MMPLTGMMLNNSMSKRINLSSLEVNLNGKFNTLDQRDYRHDPSHYMDASSSESYKFFINSHTAAAAALSSLTNGENNNNSSFSISTASIAAALSSMSSSSSSSSSSTAGDLVNDRILKLEEVEGFVNASGDIPIQFLTIILGYIFPFLLILTIIANTLVVIVLSRKHMITPTNIVLLAMAISDMLTLSFPAPWYFYMYTMGHHSRILYPTTACYLFHIMIEVVPAFFHTASIWLTLLLAIQRYIYVCYPITARTWCTVPRVVKSIVMVFVLVFLHQATRFVDRSFLPIRVEYRNETHWGCRYRSADWVGQIVNENLYFMSYYCFRILFVHVIPCSALVILNLLLFRALHQAQKTRDRLFKENRKSECRKLRDSNCTTLMLIVVVTVFLATETPSSIVTLVHVTQNFLNTHIVDYGALNLTLLFTNFFIMLTYPVNFAIYCGMSLMFRETFKNLFCRGEAASARKRLEAASRFSVVTGNGPRLTTTVVETNL